MFWSSIYYGPGNSGFLGTIVKLYSDLVIGLLGLQLTKTFYKMDVVYE